MTTPRKKLGDLLLEAGLVTRLQIDQALQAQQIFGGRFGTNLIDMEVITPDTLAVFLAQQFGVPRATLQEMENIPKEILDLVPEKAAQRLCILPLAKSADTLTIAMLDPSDDRVIRRMEENLGCKLSIRVAAEIEIRYFLEKYYGLPREMRHIYLMRKVLEKGDEIPAPAIEQSLANHLDRHVSVPDAIAYFFQEISSLDRVPKTIRIKDIKEYDLTPELTYVYLQVDGLSALEDLMGALPFSRVLSLRAFVHLAQMQLIQIDTE